MKACFQLRTKNKFPTGFLSERTTQINMPFRIQTLVRRIEETMQAEPLTSAVSYRGVRIPPEKCAFVRAKSSMPARVRNITLHASVLTPGHRAKIGVLNVSCCSTAIYPATLSRSCPEPNARSMWKRIWFCGVSNGRANNTPHCLACRWCTYNASRN